MTKTDPPLLGKDYETPKLNLSAGGVNYAYPVIYHFTGSSLQKWYVIKDTPKTLLLELIGSKSYNTRRLHKKELEVPSWNKAIFTYDKDKAIVLALDSVALEQERLGERKAKLHAKIESWKGL